MGLVCGSVVLLTGKPNIGVGLTQLCLGLSVSLWRTPLFYIFILTERKDLRASVLVATVKR